MSSIANRSAPRRKTYLHEVESNIDRRQWYRRPASLLVKIAYMQRGIRNMTTRTCRVVDISEGGAGIEISFKADVPDHFYIVLGEREYIVAAAVVEREDTMLHVQFLKLMPTRLVNRLSRITEPMQTMSAMSDLLNDIQ